MSAMPSFDDEDRASWRSIQYRDAPNEVNISENMRKKNANKPKVARQARQGRCVTHTENTTENRNRNTNRNTTQQSATRNQKPVTPGNKKTPPRKAPPRKTETRQPPPPKTTTTPPSSNSVKVEAEGNMTEIIVRFPRVLNRTVAMATHQRRDPSSAWLLDSGATVHITNNRDLLIDPQPCNNTVTVGDGTESTARLEGSVKLELQDGNKVLLREVWYIPDFNKNIVSLSKLLAGGHYMVGNHETLEIRNKNGDKIVVEADKETKMFFLDPIVREGTINNSEANGNKNKEVSINDAHLYFGHIGNSFVEQTLTKEGYHTTGESKPCESCMQAKAKAAGVSKTTDVEAEKPGERLYLDTSGPYSETLGGSQYWGKVVDQYSRKTWGAFMKKKSEIPQMAEALLDKLIAQGYKVKFLRCDNAGENGNKLKQICEKRGIKMEYTAPNTPQQNGIVERRFVTDRERAHAMMLHANFDLELQKLLWAEAVSTAEVLSNICANSRTKLSPDEIFHGKPPTLYPHLRVFGTFGYVTIRKKIYKKFEVRSQKCIFVGYPRDHSHDTYKMYNPVTKQVILTRDIQWLDAKPFIPATETGRKEGPAQIKTNDTSAKSEKPKGAEMKSEPKIRTNSVKNSITRAPLTRGDSSSDEFSYRDLKSRNANNQEAQGAPVVTDHEESDEDEEDSDSEQGEENVSGAESDDSNEKGVSTDSKEISPTGQKASKPQPTKVQTRSAYKKAFTPPGAPRLFTKPSTAFPKTTGNANKRLEIEARKLEWTMNDGKSLEDFGKTEEEQEVEHQETEEGRVSDTNPSVNSAITSDPLTPSSFKQAITGPEGVSWKESMIKECRHFLDRNGWKKTSRASLKGRSIISTRWIFKRKVEATGEIRLKSRVVIRGFSAIPGVDYTESFSPVATDTSIRVTLALGLFFRWKVEMIDYEAAFLNARLEQPVYAEWPEGAAELGLISREEEESTCLAVSVAMYGNPDSPLRWMLTLRNKLIQEMNMKQSQADPCVFYKRKENKLVLIATLYVDDTCITGSDDEIAWFKRELSRHFKIEDLGTIRKHLGVWWSFKRDNEGNRCLAASMTQFVDDVVEQYEATTNKKTKPTTTPALQGKNLK